MNPIERLKIWARLAPRPPGTKIPPVDTASERRMMLVFESTGRVYLVAGGVLCGGELRQVLQGKTAVLQLMRDFGVEDLPDIPGGLDGAVNLD